MDINLYCGFYYMSTKRIPKKLKCFEFLNALISIQINNSLKSFLTLHKHISFCFLFELFLVETPSLYITESRFDSINVRAMIFTGFL